MANFLYESVSFLVNPIFAPLLALPPALGIVLISLVVTLITTIAYKYLTDQKMLKALKEEQKEMQKEMRASRDNPKKMMELNKKAMEKSLKMMQSSFKPMFITLIPIMLIFIWLNLHLAFIPIVPGTQFTTDAMFREGVVGEATLTVPAGLEIVLADASAAASSNATIDTEKNIASWTVRALPESSGPYDLSYSFGDDHYTKTVLVTTEQAYEPPELAIKDSSMMKIRVNQEKLKVNFGLFKLSWFLAYLILAIVFSAVLRKVMKVY